MKLRITHYKNKKSKPAWNSISMQLENIWLGKKLLGIKFVQNTKINDWLRWHDGLLKE